MKRHYQTSLDRAGHSLLAGATIAGVVIAALLFAGGQHSVFALVAGWLIGGVLALIAMLATGGPIWLIFHMRRFRGPFAAATAGALAGLIPFVAGQTYGFGLFAAPPSDGETMLYRWASALAVGLTTAALVMMIALVMWRVAYRRVL